MMKWQRLVRCVLPFLLTTMVCACTTPSKIRPDDLRPFASDGCSRFPDGTLEDRKLWCHCCVVHDEAYWKGGSREQRKTADAELRNCVKEAGKPKTAALMQFGVRTGGSPIWPTRFRWGYGWPYFRGYKLLTDAERQKADELLEGADSSVCEIPGPE